MWLLPRLRYTLARRPYLYWLAVGMCASLVALRLHGAEAAAEHSAAAWGTTRAVWVNQGDAAPGASLHPVLRHYPAAVVPAAVLAHPPRDGRAARAVVDGQVLLAADVADPRTPPTDWVVLAVPAEHAPRLVPGDDVAVLHAGTLACDGMMAAVSGERLEVAVPLACAGGLSADLAGVVVARHTAPTYGATDERP